jgi:hypothetical protein
MGDCNCCQNRWETSSVGFDPNLQLLGVQPYNVGITIPNSPPPSGDAFTFMLAFARFGAHEKGCLVGIRQMLTLLQYSTGSSEDEGAYPLEFQITSPFWRPPDSQVVWGVRRIPPDAQPAYSHPANAEGLSFRYANTAALLFETPPPAYTAPFGGQFPGFPGDALTPDLAMIRDLRFPWVDDHAWDSLSVPFEGPCDIALFAKVVQTVPANRQGLALPLNQLPFVLPEDAFIATNGPAPNAVLFRIAGSLIFKIENMLSTPRELIEHKPPFIETDP